MRTSKKESIRAACSTLAEFCAEALIIALDPTDRQPTAPKQSKAEELQPDREEPVELVELTKQRKSIIRRTCNAAFHTCYEEAVQRLFKAVKSDKHCRVVIEYEQDGNSDRSNVIEV